MMPLHYMRMCYDLEVCIGTWLPKTCEDCVPILLGQMREGAQHRSVAPVCMCVCV
jgi:hypothetical protein